MNGRAFAAVIACAVLVGFVGRSCVMPRAGGDVKAAPRGAGPAGEVDSVPVGFERSNRGALAAARAWIEASARLGTMADAQRTAAFRRLAAPGRAGVLQRQFESETPGQRQFAELVDDLWLTDRVVMEATEDCDRARCRVLQYVASYLVSDRMQSPLVAFQRNVVDIRWVHGDWRLDRIAVDEGPQPLALSEPPAASTALARRQLAPFLAVQP